MPALGRRECKNRDISGSNSNVATGLCRITKETKMKKIFLLILSAFMFVSCVGIDQAITIKSDGSGTAEYNYRISKAFLDLGSYGELKKPVLFPVNKDDFERILHDAKGLSLKAYSTKNTENDLIVRAVITFDSVNDLKKLNLTEEEISVTIEPGNKTTISFFLPSGNESGITDDSLEMVKEMSEGYDLNITITAPKDITDHNSGEISKDKRSVSLKTNIYELLSVKDKKRFSITW
jgi:hypothetical protein